MLPPVLNFFSFSLPSSEPKEDDETNVHFSVVIGASCGGVFVLCLLAIFVIRQCKRHGKRRGRHASDVMPAEVAFPNAQKYEMEETKSKEDLVYFEECNIWKSATME